MKPPTPREATLRAQFHEKLCASTKKIFSETDLFELALELRLEQGFPRSLSERKFVRRLIEDAVLKTIPLSATYSFEVKRYHYGTFSVDLRFWLEPLQEIFSSPALLGSERCRELQPSQRYDC